MAEQQPETEVNATMSKRQRPIVRLGILLISHSFFFSVVLCTAGVVALLLLPVLAKNTYISENALMPGSVAPVLSNEEVSEASRLIDDLIASNSKPVGSVIGSRRLIGQYMSNLGAEVSSHKFYPQLNEFHPLHFFSSPDSGRIQRNTICAMYGVNMVGIIRAPRGDGKEAIVLVTPFNSSKVSKSEALSLGIVYSVFSLLARVPWLAKDVIWLVADSRFGEHAAVSAWLRDYHTPVFTGRGPLDAEICAEGDNLHVMEEKHYTEWMTNDGFKRAGTMAAALVMKVGDRAYQYEDSLSIYAEASNGQMPNLDLINTVNYLAVHRQGLRVKVEQLPSFLNMGWLQSLGEMFELLGRFARTIDPQLKFGIPAAEYIDGCATLASSLYNQALGVPTGPHGAFRDYQVDAVTVDFFPKVHTLGNKKQKEFLLRSGRLLEGVVQSVNNLLEKFHQSFFLYLLTSPSKFVSVGVYMIPFALLVAPLPMVAASLFVNASNSDDSLTTAKSADSVTAADSAPLVTSSESTPLLSAADSDPLPTSIDCVTLSSWNWLDAAKKSFVVYLWGSVVSLLPYFICQIPDCTPTTSFIIWVLISALSLVIMYVILASPCSDTNDSQSPKEWAILKSVTLSAAFIGLCLMSIINFATAEIGGLLIVPMCLMAHPLKLDVKTWNLRTVLRAACNLILVIVGFPPVTFIFLKGAFQGFSSSGVGDFWSWVESLWVWNSATYIFIGVVHLPSWVLCIHILFHNC